VWPTRDAAHSSHAERYHVRMPPTKVERERNVVWSRGTFETRTHGQMLSPLHRVPARDQTKASCETRAGCAGGFVPPQLIATPTEQRSVGWRTTMLV